MFSSEFCEIFKSIYVVEHQRKAAPIFRNILKKLIWIAQLMLNVKFWG